MRRLLFEEYEHQIEVIKSMPNLPAIFDEIAVFAESNKPDNLALYRLSDALTKSHPNIETTSGKTYEDWEELYPNVKMPDKDIVPQFIFDLIDYFIEKYYERNDKASSNALRTTKCLPTSPQTTNTFSSHLPIDELARIEVLLVEKGFIEIESVGDFVYAFSEKPIEEARPIKWLKTYSNNNSDNISLAILLNHIASEETKSHHKGIKNKLDQLFNRPGGKSTKDRSFEAPMARIRLRKKYKPTRNTDLLHAILNP